MALLNETKTVVFDVDTTPTTAGIVVSGDVEEVVAAFGVSETSSPLQDASKPKKLVIKIAFLRNLFTIRAPHKLIINFCRS